ncbi:MULTISPECIES: hypothetical protein [Legionella]|uniref:Uncharacterized protein n=1 Tax=Legionella maceachernii TaxID=466 RepID=A0A0W0WGI1_9GAMM|nr:hypothetical protein [Legionella maceachernii]KTD31453.1 hypothetical protein Lmac_0201 [Legionella maceachernii]SJZ93730.1 hypothetical protein SAMN02745128_01509 [Legionella maceachernii]SUP03424.1 Uncharacterised protein [Legionella maceachernii]
MGKFFSMSKALNRSSQPVIYTLDALSIKIRQFKMSAELPHLGKLLKINVTTQSAQSKTILEVADQISKNNKNSLLIWTTPTLRLKSEYDDCIYPGHNFSSVIDERGEIACSMSKRPDTTSMIGERNCVPDPRFKNQERTTRLFSPCYPSVQEEILQWFKRASAVPEYPLFIHAIPILSCLGLSITSYRDNVENLRGLQEPYTLFSFVHPCGDRYIRAGNCNAATEKSIFGVNSGSVQDLSCQEAAMKLVTRLLKQPHEYLHAAEDLGLTQGIEPSSIPEDLYHSSFTC